MPRARAPRSSGCRSISIRASRASSRCRHRATATRRAGTSSGTCRTCPPAGEIVLMDRSWYNRAGVEHVMGYCTTDRVSPVPAPGADLRADAGRGRHHPAQVLVQRVGRRAGEALHRPGRRPDAPVEAQPERRALDHEVGGLLAREGHDVRAHRHPRGAGGGRSTTTTSGAGGSTRSRTCCRRSRTRSSSAKTSSCPPRPPSGGYERPPRDMTRERARLREGGGEAAQGGAGVLQAGQDAHARRTRQRSRTARRRPRTSSPARIPRYRRPCARCHNSTERQSCQGRSMWRPSRRGSTSMLLWWAAASADRCRRTGSRVPGSPSCSWSAGARTLPAASPARPASSARTSGRPATPSTACSRRGASAVWRAWSPAASAAAR